MRSLVVLGWMLFSIAALPACGPSEEEIQKEFDAYVAARNACTVTDDCVLANADCPLGCWVAVNRAYQADVEKKARDLVTDYESGGPSCVYDCQPAVPVCTDGHCVLDPQ
jgi:hypothetical protein